jgi:hypothetical protein
MNKQREEECSTPSAENASFAFLTFELLKKLAEFDEAILHDDDGSEIIGETCLDRTHPTLQGRLFRLTQSRLVGSISSEGDILDRLVVDLV